jgi:hypothetical protein
MRFKLNNSEKDNNKLRAVLNSMLLSDELRDAYYKDITALYDLDHLTAIDMVYLIKDHDLQGVN